MWSPNELLKIEKQRDILSYITLQFFHFKKVPLEHCPLCVGLLYFIKVGLSIASFLGRMTFLISTESGQKTPESRGFWRFRRFM